MVTKRPPSAKGKDPDKAILPPKRKATPSKGAPHSKSGVKRINVALQGGGSHGAFTWGVLDRLLEDDRIEIEGVSGTSAGAMNGAAMVQGFHHGGKEGARASLDAFWTAIAGFSWLSPVHRTLFDKMNNTWNTDTSPMVQWFETVSQFFSPYQTNPMHYDPLRDLIESNIDLDALQSCKTMKLFVGATNVRDGSLRIFTGKDLSADAILASACLPFNFQAVIIDGDPYWDGGYRGNPALYPLYDCESHDIVIVQINPLVRNDVPDTAAEILNRLNEITFNGALRDEMRAIAFVQRLIEDDNLKGKAVDHLKLINMHMIFAEDEMRKLGGTSKMNTDEEFLLYLKELGRKRAEAWLKENFDRLGKDSSIDIKKTFL